jgi:hypothetical protein
VKFGGHIGCLCSVVNETISINIVDRTHFFFTEQPLDVISLKVINIGKIKVLVQSQLPEEGGRWLALR